VSREASTSTQTAADATLATTVAALAHKRAHNIAIGFGYMLRQASKPRAAGQFQSVAQSMIQPISVILGTSDGFSEVGEPKVAQPGFPYRRHVS
jgi:hypothetical protein